MARLGELLVAAGLLTVEQVEQALRAQVMWGGRLGTNLVELGYIDLDNLATALGRQHRMPPALGRHFDRADPRVQQQLSPDIAERYTCVPILFGGPDRSQLIVASTQPIDARGVAIIADEMAIEPRQIIQSIAGELRVRYHLERVYRIPRGARFLRAKGKTIPPFPQFDIDPLAFEDSQVDHPADPAPPATAMPYAEPDTGDLDEATLEEARNELRARLDTKAAEREADAARPSLDSEELQALESLSLLDDDDLAVPQHVDEQESTGRERRRYIRTLDAPPATDSERQRERPSNPSLGRIAIRRLQIPTVSPVEVPASTGRTLGEATRAIRRSQDRDRVAELVSETLFRFMLSCDAAQMLVIRGDAAIGWKGFSRTGTTLGETAVPLDQPGLIPRVIERCQTCRLPSEDLGPIDQLLLVALGATAGDLVIVPVSISGQVMCVIAMATQADASTATAESIAAAAGAAFARLMRNASR